MSRTLCICTIIALFVILACPAQAMVIKTLDIAVQNNQDAIVTFDYELNPIEGTAVFAKIVDPSEELRSALQNNLNRPVDNVIVTDNNVQVTIHQFTYETVKDNTVTMTTPGMSFENAERVLQGYWFAPLLSVDFSPEITKVSFPDQYYETFVNQISIPSVTHTVTYE